MSNGVVTTDADGNIVLINQEALKILGLKRKKVTGINVNHVLPLMGKFIEKCITTGRPQLGRHIRGKQVSLVVNVTGIKKNGKIIGSVSNFQKKQQFENAARELESYKQINEQLETIFSNSFDGLWICDGEGRIIKMNKASEKLNNIQAKHYLGKNISEYATKEKVDRIVTIEVIKTKRRVSSLQYNKKTKKYVFLTGTPVFDENGKVSLVVTNERDMTQINTITKKLKQTRLISEKYKDELAELNMVEVKKQELVTENDKMKEILKTAFKIGKMEASNILILGESGVGKGLLAKYIHKISNRKKNSFIQINCAALPESLLEAELFGYEKGAFTGAREEGKVGLFELAHKGTLFLDEIGDLPFTVQSKLLKYLDDQIILRLGSTKPISVDCVIIAATNRGLAKLTKTKKFRQDLFYRLNTFTIEIPPLRDRPDDILVLTNYYLTKYTHEYSVNRRISSRGKEKMISYAFPGNVRELMSVIKKAVVISEDEVLDTLIIKNLKGPDDSQYKAEYKGSQKVSLKSELLALEKEILKSTIQRCKSTDAVAAELGISQPTAFRKLKKHHLFLNNS